mmetsp:Transcript_58591/g.186795  ORF Transcript_58591/g.186795 Transcript_58591/m.186795 type:complete len:206 (-) Transcript_58591:10-627(-)
MARAARSKQAKRDVPPSRSPAASPSPTAAGPHRCTDTFSKSSLRYVDMSSASERAPWAKGTWYPPSAGQKQCGSMASALPARAQNRTASTSHWIRRTAPMSGLGLLDAVDVELLQKLLCQAVLLRRRTEVVVCEDLPVAWDVILTPRHVFQRVHEPCLLNLACPLPKPFSDPPRRLHAGGGTAVRASQGQGLGVGGRRAWRRKAL